MKKTSVTITIDTEFSTHKEDMGIFGFVDGQYYGVPKIQEILDQHSLKATFFVDVYTNKLEYLPEFKKLCKKLKQNGHDLQLHTHPNGLFDSERGSMKDYSLQEQVAIIRKGKEIFEQWFESAPTAHRAGDWGANYDTLEALKQNDINVDSSVFYGWPNCKLNNPELSRNRIVYHDDLLEIPATSFECSSMGLFEPYRLLSTDQNSFAETWKILKSMQKKNFPIINAVYHSFSFLRWNADRSEYTVAKNRLSKFEKFAQALSQDQSLEVRTIADIANEIKKDEKAYITDVDMLPRRGMVASIGRIFDRIKV